MNECLKVKKNNCMNCYKCIRNCSVKAIGFSSNQADIVQHECILCGRCFVSCPQHAKVVRDDLPVAKRLLEGAEPVYASIAPSFAANYPGVSIRSITKALKSLGFSQIEETAIGATIVKNHYNEMLDAGEQQIIISSCCHTVNMLIQRYFPEVLPCLAKVQSPMMAHSAAIKRENPGVKTIFIGPCISKKNECDQYPGIVDCVITFEGLSKWLASEKITLIRDDISAPSGKASLFPIAGGIIRSMGIRDMGYRYLVIDGMEQCMAALRDISDGNITERCFIEMSSCQGSCVGGPAMTRTISPIKSGLAVERHAGSDDFPVEMPDIKSLYKTMPEQAVSVPHFKTSELEEALKRIGKLKPSDELNCGSCGYDTCREKVAATISGKADEAMCMPYLMERAQSFSDIIVNNSKSGVIAMNEALEIQQMNASACLLLGIDDRKEYLGKSIADLLSPTPFAEVLQERQNIYERNVYLEEHKKYIDLSVLYDFSFRVIIAVMRDITERETAREIKETHDRKAIEITDKVIEKQMATVQIIASLLGETTAETKVALTKLKETLRNE